MLLVHRFSLASDSQAGGLVQEADWYVNAVALTLIPSPNIDEHNRGSPNLPTSLVSSSELQPSPPSGKQHCMAETLENNFPAMQPVRRREFHPPETPVSPQTANPSSYAPPYQQQPSQGTFSSSRTRILPSEPHQQLSSTSTSRGHNETKPQPIRRFKGQPPETPVSSVNPSFPPYQPPSHGISSSSQTLFSGP